MTVQPPDPQVTQPPPQQPQAPLPNPQANQALTTWKILFAPLNLLHGAVFVVILIALLSICKNRLEKYTAELNMPTAVPWQGMSPRTLQPGPVSFMHDQAKKELTFRGPMDDQTKKELILLLPIELKGKKLSSDPENFSHAKCEKSTTLTGPCYDVYVTYASAIDRLAFMSNANRDKLLISLLSLAVVVGAIGSHVRSMSAFVNHMQKKSFAPREWWPYYYVRPFYGAAFGFVVLVIIKGGFFTTGTTASDPTLWWISLAFLAGFGDREFAEKIRQIIKALFGETVDRTTTGQAR